MNNKEILIPSPQGKLTVQMTILLNYNNDYIMLHSKENSSSLLVCKYIFNLYEISLKKSINDNPNQILINLKWFSHLLFFLFSCSSKSSLNISLISLWFTIINLWKTSIIKTNIGVR